MTRYASRSARFAMAWAGLVLGLGLHAPAHAAPVVVSVEGQPAGSLSGKSVVIDPGHGLYWDDTYKWTYQREMINGLFEDLHTNEIVMDYVRAHLEGAGARVLATRAPNRQSFRATIDEKDAGYSETGSWTTTKNTNLGWLGSYRYAAISRDAVTATARFATTVKARGDYPVWVFYYAAADRSLHARFTVGHAGGTTRVTINQQLDRSRWIYIGTYPFVPERPAEVTLDNFDPQAPTDGDTPVVIADAVRFGVGMADYAQHVTLSGKPRWHEESFYYMLDHGAPESVYKTRTTDRDSGLISRALYADWEGADAFVSIHTNSADTPNTASGVTSYIHDSNPSPGSAAMQSAIHSELVRTDRTYAPDFRDRGKQSADFAVVRETRTMPATLLELAFHDNEVPDAQMLRNQRYRSDIARAIYKGLARYFDPHAVIAPIPPTLISAESQEAGAVHLRWRPESDPLEPAALPTRYRLFVMHGITGFGDPIDVEDTEYTVRDLPPGELVFFAVRAVNAGGESLSSNNIGITVDQPDAPMMTMDETGTPTMLAADPQASGCSAIGRGAGSRDAFSGWMLLLMAIPVLSRRRRKSAAAR